MAVKRKKNIKKAHNNNTHQTTNHSPLQRPKYYYYYLMVLLLVAAAAVLYVLVTAAKNNDVPPPIPESLKQSLPSNNLIELVRRYCYAGDSVALKHLMNQHRALNWSHVQYIGPPTASLIHLTLQGRHDSVSSSSMSLRGDHEGVLRYLIHELKWSASYGCPIYHALHYKNLKALSLLLNASTDTESLTCLTTIDSLGLTALHVAAKCKASGFARVYSRLFDERGFVGKLPIDVMSLLGLSLKFPPSQRVASVLTMEALNEVILHEDIELALKPLHRLNIKLSQVLDVSSNTMLHAAAYAGRFELVKMLLKYIDDTNDDPYFRNAFQQTPKQLAEAGGHTSIANLFHHENTSKVLKKGNRESVAKFEQLNWKRYLVSGWDIKDKSLDQLNSSSSYPPLCSQTLPIVHKVSEEVASYHIPLLVYSQGMESSKWNAWKNWKKNNIIERYGELEFEVSNIPYEDLYFTSPKRVTKITLKEYVNSFNSPHGHPLYLFDGKSLSQLPSLASDYTIPQWLNSSSIYLKQFILGGKQSGSPPHFHDQAINVLIYGVKEWYFWKPSQAFFDFSHVMEWKNKSVTDDPHIHCLQVPGDMIYVPAYWGHAVINKEDSVGIALEFW